MDNEKLDNNLFEAKVYIVDRIFLRDMIISLSQDEIIKQECPTDGQLPERILLMYGPGKKFDYMSLEDIKASVCYEAEFLKSTTSDKSGTKKYIYRITSTVKINSVVKKQEDIQNNTLTALYSNIMLKVDTDFEDMRKVIYQMYQDTLEIAKFNEEGIDCQLANIFANPSLLQPKDIESAVLFADKLMYLSGANTNTLYNYINIVEIELLLVTAASAIALEAKYERFIKDVGAEIKKADVCHEKANKLTKYIYSLIGELQDYTEQNKLNFKKYINNIQNGIDKFSEISANSINAQSSADSENENQSADIDELITKTFGIKIEDKELHRYAESALNMKIHGDALELFTEKLQKANDSKMILNDKSAVLEFLKVLSSIPWGVGGELKNDILNAKKILDEEHYGLEKVKTRVLEYLALIGRTKDLSGSVLCLSGPPGVGKTTLAKSIAKATGRKFQKVALGGLHEEAEIRGHRRTYLGALPGRIIQALINAGENNPVILLDEIDKIGKNTINGDPSAALLEVLDPGQNKHFNDNYVTADYDLSQVMFIATSNDNSQISAPLLDRMEVLDLTSYTQEEKFHITRNYLIPKLMKQLKLEEDEIEFTDEALNYIIYHYTQEAGVRNLERSIKSICLKVIYLIETKKQEILNAKDEQVEHDNKTLNLKNVIDIPKVKEFLGVEIFNTDEDKLSTEDRVGVVHGLAYTQYGGTVLNIEVQSFEGSGKQNFTGKLGEVMKESMSAALTVIRSCSNILGIDPKSWDKTDYHIHCPSGSVPKDGPSAGITVATAIASTMTGRKVKANVAMTGEITISGDVLAIGGLREKLVSAARFGIKKVLIPMANKRDLIEVPKSTLDSLEIVCVSRIEEVLEHALCKE